LKLDNYFEISNLIKNEKRRNSEDIIPRKYNSRDNRNWFLQLEIQIINSGDYKQNDSPNIVYNSKDKQLSNKRSTCNFMLSVSKNIVQWLGGNITRKLED